MDPKDLLARTVDQAFLAALDEVPRQEFGYHLRAIPRGVYGEPSKIAEEFAEFEEALEQGNPLMALQELSDLLGAIKGWLAKAHPSISLQDLLTMQQATERAFQSGHRRG